MGNLKDCVNHCVLRGLGFTLAWTLGNLDLEFHTSSKRTTTENSRSYKKQQDQITAIYLDQNKMILHGHRALLTIIYCMKSKLTDLKNYFQILPLHN